MPICRCKRVANIHEWWQRQTQSSALAIGVTDLSKIMTSQLQVPASRPLYKHLMHAQLLGAITEQDGLAPDFQSFFINLHIRVVGVFIELGSSAQFASGFIPIPWRPAYIVFMDAQWRIVLSGSVYLNVHNCLPEKHLREMHVTPAHIWFTLDVLAMNICGRGHGRGSPMAHVTSQRSVTFKSLKKIKLQWNSKRTVWGPLYGIWFLELQVKTSPSVLAVLGKHSWVVLRYGMVERIVKIYGNFIIIFNYFLLTF